VGHFGHKLACQSEMLVFKGPDLFLVAVITKKIKKSASRIKGVGFLRCYKNSLSKILEIFLSLNWYFTILWDTIRNYPSSPWIWWRDFVTTAKPCKWETDSQNGNEEHSNEIWLWWTYYTCVQLDLRDGGRNSETKKSKDRQSSEQFHI